MQKSKKLAAALATVALLALATAWVVYASTSVSQNPYGFSISDMDLDATALTSGTVSNIWTAPQGQPLHYVTVFDVKPEVLNGGCTWETFDNSDQNNNYQLRLCGNGTLYFLKTQNGSISQLGPKVSYPFAVGGADAHLQLQEEGNTFTVTDLRGAPAVILSVTDASPIQEGYHMDWYVDHGMKVCWMSESGAVG